MKLTQRIERLEAEVNPPFHFVMIMVDDFELPYMELKGKRAFFKSDNQLQQFRLQFQNDFYVRLFVTHVTKERQHVPADATYIHYWDNEANFIFSDNKPT